MVFGHVNSWTLYVIMTYSFVGIVKPLRIDATKDTPLQA